MRSLAVLGFVLLTVAAQAVLLKEMAVTIDGTRADVGVPIVELTTYRIDLAKALPALTDGHASLKQTSAKECRILVDGQERLRLSLDPSAPTTAKPIPAGAPFDITELPVLQKTGQGPRIYLDVRALGQITGITASVEGKTMTISTPEWWAARLGIASERLRGLNARTLGHPPDFGITPPADTMMLWVRPAKASVVQIYKGLPGVPSPMLALNTRGKPVVNPLPSDTVAMWPASEASPVQAPTQHVEAPEGGVAMYAAVVVPNDPGGDPIEAINAGKAEGWTVVGTRQRVLPTPLSFRVVAFEAGDTLGGFAEKNRMPPGLLLAMNGYGQRSKPKPGAKLIVIDNVIPIAEKRTDPKVVGLYEVRPQDTVDGLAQSWGVSPGALCQLNDDVHEGQELVPGQVLFQVSPGERPAPPKARIARMEATGTIKAPTKLLPTSAKGAVGRITIEKGEPVSIQGKLLAEGLYAVQYGEGDDGVAGFVPIGAVALQADPEVPPTSESPRADAIRREALAHLGTPYNWGGNDIAHGIDCSHFVAAVLTRSGSYAPSPPVSMQEQKGNIVHWKPGHALRGVAMMDFPNTSYPGQPSLDRLRVGDRLIIQHPPINQRSGGRHTGVYIGEYKGRFGQFKHAVVHAGSHGVAVVPFNALWSDYRYTVHDGPGARVALRAGGGR